jgi:hypothetical protein
MEEDTEALTEVGWDVIVTNPADISLDIGTCDEVMEADGEVGRLRLASDLITVDLNENDGAGDETKFG